MIGKNVLYVYDFKITKDSVLNVQVTNGRIPSQNFSHRYDATTLDFVPDKVFSDGYHHFVVGSKGEVATLMHEQKGNHNRRMIVRCIPGLCVNEPMHQQDLKERVGYLSEEMRKTDEEESTIDVTEMRFDNLNGYTSVNIPKGLRGLF